MFKKAPGDVTWTPGKIMSKTEHPRSYNVCDDQGSVYRRNSNHIKTKKRS